MRLITSWFYATKNNASQCQPTKSKLWPEKEEKKKNPKGIWFKVKSTLIRYHHTSWNSIVDSVCEKTFTVGPLQEKIWRKKKSSPKIT